MKLKTLFIINAVISLLFGLSFVLGPETLMSYYDITLTTGGIVIARLFGAALIGYAVLSWFAKAAGDSEARQAIVLSLFIGDTVGFIVALIAQLTGAVNTLGWSTVIIYLLLALGFAYFHFMKPKGS